MKKSFALVLAVMLVVGSYSVAFASVLICEQNFPDEYFREYISKNFDKDGNGMLSRQEIEDTTIINLSGFAYRDFIDSLEGIEYFTELGGLNCADIGLEKLDLSNNRKLQALDCSNNKLSELDLVPNYYLKYLDCSNNKLSRIYVRYNPELEGNIDYSGNNDGCEVDDRYVAVIAHIDEEHFPDDAFRSFILNTIDKDEDGLLIDSECYDIVDINLASADANISSLKGIEYFVELQILRCGGKQLTSLDLSRNTELWALDCPNNQLTTLDIRNNRKLRIVNYSGNPRLTNIYLPYNEVVAVNKENFPDDIFRAYILDCFDENKDGWLGDGELADVKEIRINGDEDNWYLGLRDKSKYLSSLKGIEYFYALEYLDCSLNLLTALDMSQNKKLNYLNCGCNLITDLNVSGNRRLHILRCYANNLTSLDVTQNVQLVSLFCGDNHPYSVETNPVMTHQFDLRVKDNPDGGFSVTTYSGSSSTIYYIPPVSELYTYSNSLKELDLSNNHALHVLSCNNMKLKSLNLSNNEALIGLYCFSNDIEELDLSKNTRLKVLSCYGNKIKKLDLSKHEDLLALGCSNNEIESINLENNPSIWVLHCSNNRLSKLDLSNIKLSTLGCSGNFLTDLDVKHMGTKLSGLYCYSNDLTELDVSENTALSVLSCARNKLTKLDVSQNKELWSLLCSRNKIEELKLYSVESDDDEWRFSSHHGLQELYCYDNRIRELDVSTHTDLRRLSCTNNLISELDISNASKLEALDCGGNYLAALDVSHNPELKELYFSGTTLRNVDVSLNTELISLDCISTDIMTLDISKNISLDALGCYGNSRLEALYITSNDNPAYPYKTDLREYTGETFSRITAVNAYDPQDVSINSLFTQGEPVVQFSRLPQYIVYDYETGYTGTASEDAVSRIMHVRVSVPSLNFTYLPKIESKVVSVDSKVVSIDEAITFYASSRITPDKPDTPDNPEPDNPDINTDDPDNPDNPAQSSTGSSGGGCNSGLGIFAISFVLLLTCRKRAGLFALFLVCIISSSAFGAGVKASDYTLPIPYDTYTISGTYDTNFTSDNALMNRLKNTIAEISHISADRVHSFADISLNQSWNVLPIDLYNLSRSGEYGGVVLPLTQNGTKDDRYIIHCTFSDDVSPDEQISVHGFEVDIQTHESVYDENKNYLATFIVLDENLQRVELVPENRRVYIAVSFRPEYVNTGIVTLVRGRYVEEEDPLYRLDPGAAQRIADDLGIHLEDLKYLTRANIGLPVEPTEAMKNYVKSDDHEIIINLPTISVDEKGRYIIPITLTDEEFELVKDKSIDDIKTYALNDSDLGNGQLRASFISGLLSTFEIYSLKGEKMKSFGLKEFLMVGLLDAGKPFSLYLAKILLALLMGGCNHVISSHFAQILIAGVIMLKFSRRK